MYKLIFFLLIIQYQLNKYFYFVVSLLLTTKITPITVSIEPILAKTSSCSSNINQLWIAAAGGTR